jgi:hypothetical protein
VSLAYAAGEDKNDNFRASFQTGFRNPTTQDQYIGLDVGAAILVGSAEDNLERYRDTFLDSNNNPFELTGRDAYENSYTIASVNAGAPVEANVGLVQPEKVTAFEVGYRGQKDVGRNKLTIDFSAYYNLYENFISAKNVRVALNRNLTGDDLLNALRTRNDYRDFTTYTNSTADISSYGASLGLNTKILNGFNVGLNYTYAKFDFDQSTDPDFEAGFNTPEHNIKISIWSPKFI